MPWTRGDASVIDDTLNDEDADSGDANSDNDDQRGTGDTVLDTAEIFELTLDGDEDALGPDDQEGGSSEITRFTPAMGAELDEALGLNRSTAGSEPKRRKKKVRRKASELPPNLIGEMGEANAMYASGEYNEAAKLLLEVVRQAPNCPDPYQTLGLIFEEMNDPKKALEYYMMAAHLLPKEIEGWKQVFRSWMVFENLEQAAYCSQKAFKLDPKDEEVLHGRVELFALLAEQDNEPDSYKKAMDAVEALASVTEPNLDSAMQMAQYGHNACGTCRNRLGHVCATRARAISFIETVLRGESTTEHRADTSLLLSTVNILMELYLEDEAYQHAVDLIEKWRGAVEKLPLDLTAKYAVCQIYLGRPQEAQKHVNDLVQQDSQEYADLYYDVAEAYLSTSLFSQALELYQQVRTAPQYNLPEVWFKIGKCHQATGNLEAATEILQEVHQVAPSFEEVTHMLVELYSDNGQIESALETIQNTATVAPTAMHSADGRLSELHLKQLELLLQQGSQAEFLEGCLEPLLLELRGRVRERDKAKATDQPEAGKSRRRYVALGLASMDAKEVSKLVVNAAKALCHLGRCPEAVEVLKTALSTDLFAGEVNSRYAHSLRLSLVEISWRNNDLEEAYRAMCVYCLAQPYSIDAWCLYNEIAQRAGMWYKIHRPLIRALLKHPDSVPMTVLVGHHMTASGRLKLAVGEYFRAYRAMPEQPLISLCIGVSLLRLSMHKNAVQRHKVIMDAMAFFERYSKLRQDTCECDYNFGRAFQQLGLFHLAIPHYKRVLAAAANKACLQQEAAYNLSLIYSKSGSSALAAQVLRTYVRI